MALFTVVIQTEGFDPVFTDPQEIIEAITGETVGEPFTLAWGTEEGNVVIRGADWVN